MAGKTKNRAGTPRTTGSRPSTPASQTSPRGLMEGPFKGHMGVKSSPFAPTDSKLMSQYMVLDHMTAHYRKVSGARACVDTSPPKSWLVSQKVRDRMRREGLREESRRRQAWMEQREARYGGVNSRASSEVARDEMIAMMQSMDADEVHYDEIESRDAKDARLVSEGNTSIAPNPSDSSCVKPLDSHNMTFVDKIVQDNENPPSHYRHPKPMKSNIPRESKSRQGAPKTSNRSVHSSLMQDQRPVQQHSQAALDSSPPPHSGGGYNRMPSTPRSKDLLDRQAHKFTEEKPFHPRTLKTNWTSKLSEFKYYTPPKRRGSSTEDADGVDGHQAPAANGRQAPRLHRGSVISRAETESVDWMNETIMSRDTHQHRRKTGVPPLDISLDADHLHWLKEQSQKAQLRASYTSQTRSDVGSDVGSLRSMGQDGTPLSETRATMRGAYTLNGGTSARGMTTKYPPSNTMYRVETEEDELRYLEFITDVTNDVLDRGIFTNRVLKQVFEAHIQKKKHELQVSKMREMLEDLRIDLGIPATDDPDDFGVSPSHPSVPQDLGMNIQSLEQPRAAAAADHRGTTISDSRGARRQNRSPVHSSNLPHLRSVHRRGNEGKPPLPGMGYRTGHRSRPGSASSLVNTEIREEQEDPEYGMANSGTMTMKHPHTKADVLTIHQEPPVEETEDLLADSDPESVPEIEAAPHSTSFTLTPSGTEDSTQKTEEAAEFAAKKTSSPEKSDPEQDLPEESPLAHGHEVGQHIDAQECEAEMKPNMEAAEDAFRSQQDFNSTTTSARDEEDLTLRYEDALKGEDDYEEDFEAGEVNSVPSHQTVGSGMFHDDHEGNVPEYDGGSFHEPIEEPQEENGGTAVHHTEEEKFPKDESAPKTESLNRVHDVESHEKMKEQCLSDKAKKDVMDFQEGAAAISEADENMLVTAKGWPSDAMNLTLSEPQDDNPNPTVGSRLDRLTEPSGHSRISPKPTPRKRNLTPRSDSKETPRSQELTHTSESVTVSELDEDEYGDF